MTQAKTYRKEIDGLRALAVIPVILFHGGFEWFSGGYVGVDVFFVISGYLITSIILREKEATTFNLAHFYERRARRILPALFFILFVCPVFTPDLKLISFDGGHLTRDGAKYVGKVLFQSPLLKRFKAQ